MSDGASVNLADYGVHVILLVRSLFPVLELDDGHTVGGTLAGDHAVAGHLHEVSNLGVAFDPIRNLLHDHMRSRRSEVPGAVVTFTMIVPWSSSGTRPVLVLFISRTSAANARPSVDHISHLCLMKSSTPCLYLLIRAAESRVECLAEAGRKVVAHLSVFVEVRFQDEGASAGESVRAFNAEIPTATAIVIPNCV